MGEAVDSFLRIEVVDVWKLTMHKCQTCQIHVLSSKVLSWFRYSIRALVFVYGRPAILIKKIFVAMRSVWSIGHFLDCQNVISTPRVKGDVDCVPS